MVATLTPTPLPATIRDGNGVAVVGVAVTPLLTALVGTERSVGGTDVLVERSSLLGQEAMHLCWTVPLEDTLQS